MTDKILRSGTDEFLREMIRIETEGELSPAQSAEAEEIAALEQQFQEAGIKRVEQLLDGEQMRRVLTLTPEAWKHMSAPERRIMEDWVERRIKVLGERLCFIRRNKLSEVIVPDCYMGERA